MSASHWKPKLWPVHTVEQAIAAIEEMSGEKLTAEEIEELRQAFDDDDQQSRFVH